jgi:hypothetical protein
MPCPDRRNAITAAVEAHNLAHPTARLARPAARMLAVMFDTQDVCRQSLDALSDASSVSRPTAQSVLRGLLAAGVIAKEEKGHGQHANRYRLHLSLGTDA